MDLKDLFYVAQPNENFKYRGRIAQRHVDFVLCDAKNMRPLMGIELDDGLQMIGCCTGWTGRSPSMDLVFPSAVRSFPEAHVSIGDMVAVRAFI